jgi:hypothetical protein
VLPVYDFVKRNESKPASEPGFLFDAGLIRSCAIGLIGRMKFAPEKLSEDIMVVRVAGQIKERVDAIANRTKQMARLMRRIQDQERYLVNLVDEEKEIAENRLSEMRLQHQILGNNNRRDNEILDVWQRIPPIC